MLKTRRQHRYELLRASGFLPFEARPLSRVPRNVPYLKELTRERRGEFLVRRQGKISEAKYEQRIKDKYQQNGWLKRTRAGIVADPWQLLRAAEERWRDKSPQYESPWEGKGRRWRDFLTQIERTMTTQRGVKRREYLEPQ